METQIAHTKQTITYLESVENALEQATVSEISDIKEELIQTGFIKQKHRNNKKQKMLPPEKYQASDGTMILVGKTIYKMNRLALNCLEKAICGFTPKIFLVLM